MAGVPDQIDQAVRPPPRELSNDAVTLMELALSHHLKRYLSSDGVDLVMDGEDFNTVIISSLTGCAK